MTEKNRQCMSEILSKNGCKEKKIMCVRENDRKISKSTGAELVVELESVNERLKEIEW